MQISEITGIVEEADRGRWFQLLHPVDGTPAGVSLLVAGPDSKVQARAMAALTDDLAEVADPKTGAVTGEDRAKCRKRFLARLVLDWKATEDGEPVPFTPKAVEKLIGVAWVAAQLDAFGGSRAVYFAEEAGGDNAAA